MGRPDSAVFSHSENFDASLDVAEEDPFSVRGKDQTGVAELAVAIGMEDLFGGWLRVGFLIALAGEGDALKDLPGSRIDDD